MMQSNLTMLGRMQNSECRVYDVDCYHEYYVERIPAGDPFKNGMMESEISFGDLERNKRLLVTKNLANKDGQR